MLPLQRRISAAELPSQRQRLAMLENAGRQLTAAGYDAIGMDHYALSGDSLAVGPTAISQFQDLVSQNQRDLKAYYASIEAGRLPVERGLVVTDPAVLERRAIIKEVMCHFSVTIDLERFGLEWQDLQALAADGLVSLRERHGRGLSEGLVDVTPRGRWLIRTVAAVFDPDQRRCARGSRLV